MFKEIDFKKEKPFWVNGDFKWYFDTYLQEYIKDKQAENLPKLSNLNACIVWNEKEKIKDYLLIDGQQNIIGDYNYKYNFEGFDQMVAKINILKISKHFDDVEK